MAWNPYYDEWVSIHDEAADVSPAERRELRGLLIRRYAFAVPSEEALALIGRYGPIVEVGAGSGYWARCLRERDVDVVAYDEMGDQWRTYFRTPDSTEPELWTEVVRGGPERLATHGKRTLLLCWPDPWTGMDEASLLSHPGDRLVYVGELGSRGPGSEGFHRRLRTEWREVARAPVPQWDGCDDLLLVYEREVTGRSPA